MFLLTDIYNVDGFDYSYDVYPTYECCKIKYALKLRYSS